MKLVILLVLSMFLAVVAGAETPSRLNFYSSEGREHRVSFRHSYRTKLQNLEQVREMNASARRSYAAYQIEPVMKYLFGPLTHRSLASPQKGLELEVDWNSARVEAGRVVVDYTYEGTWIVDKDLPLSFPLPVPLNESDLYSSRWKSCTDSDPEHQTSSFYWYFWDPSRWGCDHVEGIHYSLVEVRLGEETRRERLSYPEYSKLLASGGLSFTFAFGYVTDPLRPEPETDRDSGAAEYRKFVRYMQSKGWAAEKILQREYQGAGQPHLVIGHRFRSEKGGVRLTVNAVMAAGIDQMELFAKSFAHDHDGFFGWFGHSRVGSGFDAEQFARMLRQSPEYYSLSPKHQLVYWAGCNSYSYYTQPFFQFKARLSGDPQGTKGLDIIANGLPSYFHFNADNAIIVLDYLLRWEAKPSYQEIVNALEARAAREGVGVLVAVLGDEDNDER